MSKDAIDYLVVHELCHLKQMNHSIKFWKLVEGILPDYKISRKEIKSQNFLLQSL